MKNLILSGAILLLSACAANEQLIGQDCDISVTAADQRLSRTMLQDIQYLTSPQLNGRKTGSAGAELTRSYLQQRLSTSGLQPWLGSYSHEFQYQQGFISKQGRNLVGWRPGHNPTRWRLLLAHYDHLGGKAGAINPNGRYFPGADDNASGVAALLTLAGMHSQIDTEINLLLVFTDAEEPGLYGSKALLEQLQQQGLTHHIELVLNLDMVGRPDNSQRLYIQGLQSLRAPIDAPLIREALRDANQTIGLCVRLGHPRGLGRGSFISEQIDWLRASDHYPFHRQGIPWLFMGSGNHPQYHTEQDTAARINPEFLARVVLMALALLSV
ncbi:M20/M25/M40 family metallo-hydrolase [Shewanella sp. GXUN23E]|uniref:M20/M25/M40 family metallo-hydrolase n=1 Tax=Shewanella sp. GXUN23E TaxID=3422498 RepID=UPI003D7E5388